MEQRKVELGAVQETLLMPLYARAAETRRPRPLIRDQKAVEVVDAIDYDFAEFDNRPKNVSMVFRGEIFDDWVREFLTDHPDGTVVEIGAGLNTRYERLDNGRATWIEFDLPDAISLRRTFFADTDRRTMVEGSIAEPGAWFDAVEAAPGPHLFVAEAVLIYLPERDVRTAIDTIRRHFPGSVLLMDTATAGGARGMQSNPLFKRRNLVLDWSCEDPRALEEWGMRLVTTRTMLDPPPHIRRRMSPVGRVLNSLGKRTPVAKSYWLNRFEMNGADQTR